MNDKSSTKLTYSYGGPVYRFNRIYSDYWEAYTEAVSLKQAINNFNFKAKKAFGFANTANIHIDPDYVVCEDNYPEDTEVEVCQNCGNILNDAGECPLCDLHDESVLDEKLESEELFSMTPYMLRNDGKLLECGELHPYIKMSNSTSYETNLKTLNNHLDFLDWFYNNTLSDETKELIEEFKKEPSEELMNLLNDLTNQEFCRVRTSNYKVKYGGDNGQIYFRISSTGFNWFDLIWNIVFKYSKDIREVTVMKDKQTFGGKEFEYYYDHMPVDEFLSLKGNPVIESYEENKDRIFNKTNTEKHNTLKQYQDEFEKLISDWKDLKLDDNSFIEECNKLLNKLDTIDKSKVYDVELSTLQNNINSFIKRVFKINKLVSKQLEEKITEKLVMKDPRDGRKRVIVPESIEEVINSPEFKKIKDICKEYSNGRGIEESYNPEKRTFEYYFTFNQKYGWIEKDFLAEFYKRFGFNNLDSLATNKNGWGHGEYEGFLELGDCSVRINTSTGFRIYSIYITDDVTVTLEDLEEDYYDEPAVKVAKRIAKALKLSKYDLNTLIHDINNLRGSEWLEQVESIGDEELLKQFKEVAQLDLKEDIEKHDVLNPKLFENNELKEEIADKLEEVALTFIDQVKDDEIKIDLKDIVIVGSNVNYNYTKDSDIDLHIIVDSTNIEPEKLYAKIYDLERSNFNSNYDIFVKDIPVEIYVELDEPKGISGGIYSLFTGWVKEPVQKDIPDIDQEAFEKLFTEWEDKYFALLDSTDDEEDIDMKSRSEKIDEFIDNLYELRKSSIAKDGEFGLGNLVFKEFRNLGYLDNLKELKKQEKSKELSLN